MPTRITLALLVLAAFYIAFQLGRPPRVVQDPVVAVLPEDLDAWLAERERAVVDLMPGADARLTWADTTNPSATEWSVVALHGFTATRQETAPLAEFLACTLGANLYEARLTGHGRPDVDALGEATASDWVRDAVEALAIGRRMGERILVVGTSTGGTLAAWLAATERLGPSDVVVLISPNFRLPDSRAHMLLWPWGKVLASIVEGKYREWSPHNEDHGRFWTTRYPSSTLVELAALLELVERADFGAITSPTLVLYGPHDRIVDATRTIERFGEIGVAAKRIVSLERGEDPDGHVMAGSALSPSGTGEALDHARLFLANIDPPAAPLHNCGSAVRAPAR